MNHQVLSQLATQLETKTGKLCVYKGYANADATDVKREYQAEARQHGFNPDVVVLEYIYDPTGDYAFVLVPKELEEIEEDGYDLTP